MSEKTLSVRVQYVLFAEVTPLIRPYELTAALSSSAELWLDTSPLPQENHWKLVITAKVSGTTQAGALAMVTSCAMEAIVQVEGFDPDETQTALRFVAAPAVLGSVRSLVSQLTQGTGLGTVVLGPMAAQAVAELPALAASPAVPAPLGLPA